jgi:hypothetical protein
MSGPLLVGAEEVIIVPNAESYAAGRPIMEGLELVTQLMHFPTTQTIVLVGIVDTTPADYFCKINGLAKTTLIGIRAEDRHEDPALAQWYAIERQRSRGPVNMVLTAYTTVYERCKSSHQPVMLFARRGSLGALEERTAWEDLHAQVIRSRDAAVEDLYEEDQ